MAKPARTVTLHDARRESAVTLTARPLYGAVELTVEARTATVWGQRVLYTDPTALDALAAAIRADGAAALDGDDATLSCREGRLAVALRGPDLRLGASFGLDPSRHRAFAEAVARLARPLPERWSWQGEHGWMTLEFEDDGEVAVEGGIAIARFSWRGPVADAVTQAFRARPSEGRLDAEGLSIAVDGDEVSIRCAAPDLEVAGRFTCHATPPDPEEDE